MLRVGVDDRLREAVEIEIVSASVASAEGGVSNMVNGVASKVTADGSEAS